MSMTITACEVPSGPLKLRTDAEGAAPQFKLETFDRKDAPLDKVVEAIRWNGGVVVKNFLNAAELEQAEKAVRPFLDKAQYPSTEDPTKRLARLPTVNPELTTKIFTDDLYLGIIDEFLSVEFDSWLGNKSIKVREQAIATMSSIFEVGPGAKKQDLHRDDAIWYNNIPRCAPGQYERGRDKSISFFIAGCKTTVENGATMFIPGSHLTKWDDQPDPRLAVSAELDAGDAFFMLSSCYHGAGENSTKDQYRLVYAMFSMQPHLRQEENFYLTIPLETVKAFPLSVQKRLGYDVAVPNLGWVDHKSPLVSVLEQEGADLRDIPGYKPPKVESQE